MAAHPTNPSPSQVLIYKAEEGSFRLEVPTDGDTVWLTQQQMADLFGKARTTIVGHIGNIFEEGELIEEVVCRDFRHTTPHGAMAGKTQTKAVRHYNLDVIISVGYRVKSLRGTQFRIWATGRLREFLVKGFTMDDARLKEAGNSRYFEELLQRIRDIRSSEKVFWRKVLDIFATSIDYEPKSDLARAFFRKIQNQLHWAAHGHTAAEVIHQRADADRPMMGITNFPGKSLLKRDTEVAKNYLDEKELDVLNRIVTAYLEMAELQAMNRIAMTMDDWLGRLHDFLAMTGRDLLDHAGKVSHDEALRKAHREYEAFKSRELEAPSDAECHFIEQTERELKALEARRRSGQT